MAEYDKNCSFGIANQKEIEKIQDKLSMVVDNFNRNVQALTDNMEKQFNELNNKVDKIDGKIDKIDADFTKRTTEIVENRMKVGVYGVVKWIALSGAGVAISYIITSFLKGRM